MAVTLSRKDITSIIPFYADPELSVSQFAALSTAALHTVADIGLHHQVILVDDARTLQGKVDIKHIVKTVSFPSRLGKAGSVRQGLTAALHENPRAQFFIQSDFDGDPDPKQIRTMIRYILGAGISSQEPAMILGERDVALAKSGYLSAHRKAIFLLQKKFCRSLNFRQLVDPTTGLRIYTRALAELFVKRGRSSGFGSDVEQLIIARLCNARVLPYKLRRARKRLEYTYMTKFEDCQAALSLHEHELRAAGFGKVVDTFGSMDFSQGVTVPMNGAKVTFVPDGHALRGLQS